MLEPEWLDLLSPRDARAQRSRTDLLRVNRLMGNARHVTRALARFCQPDERTMRIVDLGAGDGRFMLDVARRMHGHRVHLYLVDRIRTVDEALVEHFGRYQWKATPVTAEALDFLAQAGPAFDAIVANLFLHHFDAASLRRLLELVAQRTALFVACEPRRSRFALQASRLLRFIGCNDVTRHDAVASVRAGFHGPELCALWPERERWRLVEGPARPFGHLFVAQRHAAL